MRTLFHLLQQMYNDVLIGAPFSRNSCSCAALLNPPVDSLQQLLAKKDKSCTACILPDTEKFCTPDSVALRINDKPDTVESCIHSGFNIRDITLLQLTLISMVLKKVQSQEVAAEIKKNYLEIITILQKEANIVSKLIHLLCSSDKQLSYQASKSLVSMMHFQLTKESSLSGTCSIFYLKALSEFHSCNHVAECLWSLTKMIGEILKDEILCKEGGLKKFLTPLDNVLEGFYNCIVSYSCGSHQDDPVSAKVTNDLSSFLDLIELIVASRAQTPLNFACQRMLFLNASCVLHLATSSVHSLVKKKSVMLLKKCLLHKAGDDLIKGRVPAFYHDPNFDDDRLLLVGAVLQFVNTGWLNQLSVSGKTRLPQDHPVKPEVDISNNPDQVTLRALSLVLLKTLELKIQDSASEVEAQALLESIMCPLLTFLESHLRSSRSCHLFHHPCMWLSEVFIEQDDDMLEAARTLLMIHLKFERLQHKVGFAVYPLDDGTQHTWTHQNGCNPHCIFLYLLKNIAFDATVLLDFLISSETCFLEYFVRYLKFLVQDWYHFVKISEFFKTASSRDLSFSLEILPCPRINTYQSGMNLQTMAYAPQSHHELVLTSQLLSVPQHVNCQANFLRESHNMSSREAFKSLVDYESSEDSETEWAGEECMKDIKQRPLDNQSCSGVTVMDVVRQAEASEQNRLTLDRKSLNTESPLDVKISFSDPGSAEGILEKTIKCFQQLQQSISRLHARNLFPYNPGALLKLLTHVHTINREHRFASKQPKPGVMQHPPSTC